ncbi:glycine cleavage system aminomethyltransferase GcvT [Endozoicomonas sp. SCSIO W0465]|uniref:glycine cleavage system aminomethyltransferase GcvT n=1 Tax=Endozoicomonas sp. SCSIO W0465 TaxID=2918516 RepID=UPI002075641E|nr:glycine cleavage system aminomethyltransferase GcvT [Endozoicomonas sp. SCSIO W0465]USE33827.1 glycine cleavage system aminomethyltransferase GcvT [Endozoicomonas sp. SCSIO W0465]
MSEVSEVSAENLKRTPLYELHLAQRAKMVPFAGYEMPVQYPSGVKKEHIHTRGNAGVFDVSHMGQLKLCGDGADYFLESLVPVDIVGLPAGKQRYALFTNEAGGILDDLMVTRYDDCLYLVVNAACKERDTRHLQSCLPEDVTLEPLNDRALIAIQGPMAAKVMQSIVPDVADMLFMDSRQLFIDGVPCFISRSGYTGEDGFEISIPEKEAERITRQLLNHPDVELIGLGARDSLRLESGLCLYGQDIDVNTTPAEASLAWAISKNRRNNGERAGGFPGAEKILNQIATGQVTTKRIGLIGSSRAPVREGAELVNDQGQTIGRVTSGTFGPTVGAPVAMAMVNANYTTLGTELYALVRGKKLPMTVCKMPFIEQRYYRG